MIFPLRLKLVLAISFLLGFTIGTIAVLLLRQSTQALEEEARKRGTSLAVNLAHNARLPLLEQDDVVLGELLETIAGEAEILGARLLDADGEVAGAAGTQVPVDGRLLGGSEELATVPVGRNLVIASRVSFNEVDVGEAQVFFDLAGLIARIMARAQRDVILASGALLMVGFLIALWIGSSTTRPLRRLRLAVEALAAGDLSARVKPTTRDEVADLTRAFNQMGESLGQKQRVESAFRRYVSDHVLREVLDAPESVALQGERREVSVIFIDIRDFTRLTSRLGPERLVSFLNDAFELITNRLLDHGATVDKYIGDAILAYFGAPIETPDHPERAVAAAIAVQRSARERNRAGEQAREPLVRLDLGIGIHTGPVVVGNIGSEFKTDYTAIGDPVNVANRIQSLARPGEILVTHDVARRLGSRVKLEPLGPRQLAGRDAPVEIHRVVY